MGKQSCKYTLSRYASKCASGRRGRCDTISHQFLRRIHSTDLPGSNDSLFSCRFSLAEFFFFFLCFIPCTHSLIPKKSGVRRGFKVKWMDVIVAEENKTMRAYSKASWRCQKDIEVGQQISLSKYTSEGVTGGRRWAPPLKQSNFHKTFGEDVCRIFPVSRAPVWQQHWCLF